MKMLDLFSGIGGFALAATWTWKENLEILGFCEIDKYCQKVLKKHWPNVPIYEDIKKLNGNKFKPVDILTGGFPCQSFSFAGKRKGKKDDRYLWPEMFRIIQETQPTWILAENVAGIIDLALDTVLSDLESKNYETETFIIPACGINAPHKRERVWIVAYSDKNKYIIEKQSRKWKQSQKLNRSIIPKLWFNSSPSEIIRTNDGLSSKLDTNRCESLGNAIVPQVAMILMQYIKKIEQLK